MIRVLIIEDHEDVAANIGDFLEVRGHEPDFALDGLSGLHLAVTREYDVIVLDLGLPGMDGLTLCRRLREDAGCSVPILMLTARDTLPDKLAGFDAGTDDYLVKPFALQELEVRLRALVRRSHPSTTMERRRVGDLELDAGTLEVTRGGQHIELNPTAFRVLEILMEASPRVVRRADLERQLWGDEPPDSDALRSHIYAIRRAIDRPFPTSMLRTVHGVGYRLIPGDST